MNIKKKIGKKCLKRLEKVFETEISELQVLREMWFPSSNGKSIWYSNFSDFQAAKKLNITFDSYGSFGLTLNSELHEDPR